MKIETKFNPGDLVWIMINNKPINYEIYEVIPGTILKSMRYKDQYTMMGYNGNSPRFYEDQLFLTKEELIKSL